MKRLIIPALIVALLAGCTGRPADTTAADTIVDDYGRTVVLGHRPQRIVSASPAITELMYALNQSHRLVGRTDFCSYPAAADTITSIGGISNLNVEYILALRPDLVIAASMMPEKSVDQLEQMGVPVVCIIEKQHYKDLYGNISKLGEVLRCQADADSLITSLESQLQGTLSSNIEKRPSIYYVVGFGATGNFTAGGNTFINDIIQMAGGYNTAHDIQGWSYSLEALMQSDPDYIVVRREDSATFCHTRPYNMLSAVRQGRVIGIESGILDLQVPRNIEAIKILHNHIHGNN